MEESLGTKELPLDQLVDIALIFGQILSSMGWGGGDVWAHGPLDIIISATSIQLCR